MITIFFYLDIFTGVTNPYQHSGHFEFQPEHLLAQICLMSEEQKQLARDCAQLNFSSSITTALLNLRKGLGMPEWKDSQIEHFLKVEKEEFSMLTPNSSSADKLIYSFKQRNDVNYLYVTYHPDEGMLMMTQKQRKQVKDFRSGKNTEELDHSLQQLYIANTLSGDDRLFAGS